MEQQQQLPKRRGRVTESLDEFLKTLKKQCKSTIDPAPRKKGRPSESLKIHNKFKYYSDKPFSKRGRPPINLVMPGYIIRPQTMKEKEEAEVLETSQEKSASPEIDIEKEDVEEEEKKELETNDKLEKV